MRQNPAFGVSDKARLKPVSLATETSYKIEISLVASPDMIFSIEWKTHAWSDCADARTGLHILLFTSPKNRFSPVEAQFVCIILVPKVNVSSFSFGHGIYRIHISENVCGKSPKFASRESTVSLFISTETYNANKQKKTS